MGVRVESSVVLSASSAGKTCQEAPAKSGKSVKRVEAAIADGSNGPCKKRKPL